jgi:hypothetical protein
MGGARDTHAVGTRELMGIVALHAILRWCVSVVSVRAGILLAEKDRSCE